MKEALLMEVGADSCGFVFLSFSPYLCFELLTVLLFCNLCVRKKKKIWSGQSDLHKNDSMLTCRFVFQFL